MFEDSEMVFVLTEGFLFDPLPSFEQPQLLSVNLMRIMIKNFQENSGQFDEDFD